MLSLGQLGVLLVFLSSLFIASYLPGPGMCTRQGQSDLLTSVRSAIVISIVLLGVSLAVLALALLTRDLMLAYFLVYGSFYTLFGAGWGFMSRGYSECGIVGLGARLQEATMVAGGLALLSTMIITMVGLTWNRIASCPNCGRSVLTGELKCRSCNIDF